MVVTLGQAIPRHGFQQLPSEVLNAITAAVHEMPPAEEIRRLRHSPTGYRLYAEHLARRARFVDGRPPDPRILRRARRLSRVLVPKQLTTDDIRVDFPTLRYRGLRSTPWEVKWDHYGPALCLYWAMFYHLPNCWLRDPDALWTELMHDVGAIYRGLKLGVDGFQLLLLALYERTLGFQYDAQRQLPHYVENILRRPELTPEERVERARYFRTTVVALRRRIEAELLER